MKNLEDIDMGTLTDELGRKLQLKGEYINGISSLMQIVGAEYRSEDLYNFYILQLTKYLGVEDILFYVYDKEWVLKSCKNTFLTCKEIVPVSTVLNYRKPAKLEKEDSETLGGYSYVIPIYYNDTAISFSLIGKIKNSGIDTVPQQFQYAQILTNIITLVIENKRLIQEELEKKDFEKDMELASKIQGMIIPNKLPNNHLYKFSGLYLPHRSIGGDYYDVININKDEFLFCIGDISGKGVAAALVMANLQAYLNASPPYDLNNGRVLIDRLNQKILSITNGEKFITLFIAKYNILSRELLYINAGHNPPILMNGEDLISLDKGCALLGILEQIPSVSIGRVLLEKNAVVLAYTDGLSELENESGDFYGTQRLKQFLIKNKTSSLDDISKNLYLELVQFKGRKSFNDDVSVLLGEFC
ncbi:MAG: SpoIIE family protein phosphatase [Chitinophagales bacterium]|nr:SpoIIE family protein phosphatase [Chitinophagales bacterium]